MILVGENIHIISKSVREILEKRDENAIKELISMQQNMDYIDLNVGPAKNKLANILPWLADIVQENSNLKISFDTTNSDEMQKGLAQYKNSSKAFINSTSKDEPFEMFDNPTIVLTGGSKLSFIIFIVLIASIACDWSTLTGKIKGSKYIFELSIPFSIHFS